MKMMPVYILDFNDSFTHNIAAELAAILIEATIIPFSDINNFLEKLIKKEEPVVLIYGPGPGHPKEYSYLFPVIEKMLERKNCLNVGICLGHQIIWLLKGYSIKQESFPVHGREVEVFLPKWFQNMVGMADQKVFVQKYNSLFIDAKTFDKEKFGTQILTYKDELLSVFYKNIITYQFHPESIGTSCPEIFFLPIKDFLYNNLR